MGRAPATGPRRLLSAVFLVPLVLTSSLPAAHAQMYAGGSTLAAGGGGTRAGAGRVRSPTRAPGMPSFGPVPVTAGPGPSQAPPLPPIPTQSASTLPTRPPAQPSLGLPSNLPAPSPDIPIIPGGIVRTRQVWFSGPECSGETISLYSPDNGLCLRAGTGAYRLTCATEQPSDAQQPGIGATGAGVLTRYSDASCRNEAARIPFVGNNGCISFSRDIAESGGLPGLSLRAVCSDPLGRPGSPSVPAPPLPQGITLPGGNTQGSGILAAGRFRLDFYSDQPGCAEGQSAANRNRTVTILAEAGTCLPALGPFAAFQSFKLSCIAGVDTQGLQNVGQAEPFALVQLYSQGACQGTSAEGQAVLGSDTPASGSALADLARLGDGQLQIGAVALGMSSGGCIASPLGICTSSLQAWCGAVRSDTSTPQPPSRPTTPSSSPAPSLAAATPSTEPAVSPSSAAVSNQPSIPSISPAPSTAPARPPRALVDVSFYQGTPEGGIGILGCEVPVRAPQGSGVRQTIEGAAAGSCITLPPSNATGSSTGPYTGMRVLCDQARGIVPGIPTGGTLRLCRPPVPLAPGTTSSGTGSGAGSASACGTCDGPARVFANSQCISPLPGTGGIAIGATLACYPDPTGMQ